MTRASRRRRQKTALKSKSTTLGQSASPASRKPVPRFKELNTNPNLSAVRAANEGVPAHPGAPGVQRPALVTRVSREMFSGPIPPAAMMAQYDQVVPGAADRILAMAEEQQRHRHRMEWHTLVSDTHRSYWGLACGLVITLAFGSGGVWLGLTGHEDLGRFLFGGTLVTIVGIFVAGTIVRRNERREKAKISAGRTRTPARAPGHIVS